MVAAIRNCWSLFLGIGFLMLAHGLQGSLIALRASIEGYSTITTGIIMTGFFSGYVIGSIIVPKFVNTVGHVRVFAALVAVASCIILVQSILVEPVIWTLLRFIMGMCIAGLYLIAESWLNDIATNESRGQILSFYMVVVMGGLGFSQFFLNLADPTSSALFILISVLLSLSSVPMLLSAGGSPDFSTTEPISLATLYRSSPLGTVGIIAVGIAQASLYGMGPVYAIKSGMEIADVALFMFSIAIGAILIQWPVGWLSDKYDRRIIIVITSLFASLAVLAVHFAGIDFGIFIMIALYGGLSIPIYSLCIAYTNDHLNPNQRVSASGALVLLSGTGAAVGPFICGLFMSHFGNLGFLLWLFIANMFIALFGIYRMTRRRALPVYEQDNYGTVTIKGSTILTGLASQAGEGESGDKDIRSTI